MNSLLEDNLQQLLNFQMPFEQALQAQPLQITQGLLGTADTGGQGTEQQDQGEQHKQDLQNLIGNTMQEASKMAQVAQPQQIPNRNAQLKQEGMQAALQQRQQGAQAGALLGKIASFFMPGGSVLGYLKR